MAFSYRDIEDRLTTVTGEYNPKDGDHIYLSILKKWFGTILYQLQVQLDGLADWYPFRPYYRIVKADTTVEKFASNPEACGMEQAKYTDEEGNPILLEYFDNEKHCRISGDDLIYDFKLATFIRVSMTGERLPSNDTSTAYQDLPFVSERFRFQQNAKKANIGKAGVMLQDDLSKDFEKSNKTVLTVPFLANQNINKQQRAALVPSTICTGGQGKQRARGNFSYLITSSALLIGGSLSEIPYTLFNFLIGREALTNNLIAFSNGVARIPQLDNALCSDFIFVPSKMRSSSGASNRITAEDLILRYGSSDKDSKNVIDYLIPNTYVTSEFIQSNYMQVQGEFRQLSTMRIASPDPEVGADMDMSGALCLLCALEAFPTRNKIIMFR